MFNKLLYFLKGAESIKAKVLSGVIWMMLGGSSEQALRLVRNMILTRMLAPDVFGVVAIVLSVNAAFESFTQIGVKEAIIQNPRGDQKSYLNGAWLISAGRAIALYLIMFTSAPYVAEFYNNDRLGPLFRIAFLGVLFTGLMSPEAYVSLKKMKFKTWVWIFHGGGGVGILASLALAFYLKNEWALVIGFTVESLSRLILSYIFCPFMPRLNFKKEDFNALIKYAKGMLGLPILTFIFMKCDVFVIGKICDFSDLGLYSMVSIIAWFSFGIVTMITSQVMMPAFSERQADKIWVNRWILNITELIMFFGFPLFFLILFSGKDLLTIVYGEKYGDVALPFTIIFLTAMLRTASVPIATLFLASGHPEYLRLFTGIRAVLILILIYPAVTFFGLIGAASAGLFSMVASYIFQMGKIRKVTGLNLKKYLSIAIKASIIAIPIVIISIVSRKSYSASPLLNIIPGVVGCFISYGIALKIYLKTQKTY